MYLSGLHNGTSMIIRGVIITVKNEPRNSLAKFVVPITSVIYSKKGNYRLKTLLSEGRHFRGIVTFGIRYKHLRKIFASFEGLLFREGGTGR